MAIKKGNIGNALNSVAPDHVVVTTDGVFDETQNKYQNEINNDIGGDISDIESDISSIEANIGYYECSTGASTAAKTVSASGYSLVVGGAIKVKFINTNTASDNVTLNINEVGAKPLYYNGNLVDANHKWRAGEVVNIYYDGTNYQANSVDGGSGDGVYDISAEHLTEGNPTQYSSLADALGTNGANIPADKRKGGMSIKFIQSSDNNYVQYRYMLEYQNTTAGNNAFLNTANWQGVDAEPTAGSENFVESRGVVSILNDKYFNVGGINANINKGFINSSNAFINSGGSGVCIRVNIGDEVTIKAGGSQQSYYALLQTDCYFENEAVFVEGESRRTLNINESVNIIIPSGCKYLFVCLSTTTINTTPSKVIINNYDFFESIYQRINRLHEETNLSFNHVEDEINDFNDSLYSVKLILEGVGRNINIGFINSSNVFNSETGSGVCIPINYGQLLQIVGSRSQLSYYAFLKENVYLTGQLVFCSGETRNSIPINTTVTPVVPNDCKYLYICKSTSTISNCFPLSISINGTEYLSVSILDDVETAKNINNRQDIEISNLNKEILGVPDEKENIFITSSNQYRYSEQDECYIVPVKTNDTIYLESVSSSSTYSYYGLIKTLPSGTYPDFMEGHNTRESYRPSTTITVPEDGYILVVTSANESANQLKTFTINGVSPFTPSVREEIQYLQSEIDSIGDISNVLVSEHDMFNLESYWWLINKYLDDSYSPQEATVFNSFKNTFRAKKASGVYQFAVISDTHGSGAYSWRSISDKSFTTCFRSIALFLQTVSYCDAAIHGGDISCDYGTSRRRYIQYAKEILRMFRFTKPFFITKGNHDENYNPYIEVNGINIDWLNKTYYKRSFSTFTAVTRDTWRGEPLYVKMTELISDNEFRNNIQQWLCPQNAVWGTGAYYYYDIDDVKIRFIVANSFPVNDDYQEINNEEYVWFAQTALNLSAKSNPQEWSVIVLRHTRANTEVDLTNCINAFKAGSTWTFNGSTVDFGTMNGGPMTFIAHIHGHEHQNIVSNRAGYFDIGEDSAFSEPGDVSNYGLSVLSVDLTNKKIYEDTISGHSWCYDYYNNKIELPVGETILLADSGTCVSSDNNIATVSDSLVTAISVGDVIISITTTTSTYTYSVKVV